MTHNVASVLKTDGLVKQYSGRRVVDQVNLELHKGEIVGLLGPNGAGKTTTFNMIVGITRPNAGRILLDGADITSFPMHRRARRGIGYLAQEKSVFRKLTVEQNIRAIAEILPLSATERQRRTEMVLEELGVTHLRRQPAYTLSGGERRRVEIARALVCEPSFMLLDEPFSGVDPKAVEELQNVIYQMQRRGLGILITDHSVRETLTVTDRAYLIYEGKVLISGTAAQLVNDPKARQYYLGERFYMDIQPDTRKTFFGSLFGRRDKTADQHRPHDSHPPSHQKTEPAAPPAPSPKPPERPPQQAVPPPDRTGGPKVAAPRDTAAGRDTMTPSGPQQTPTPSAQPPVPPHWPHPVEAETEPARTARPTPPAAAGESGMASKSDRADLFEGDK